ncbi:hypothetical protein LAZ67_4003783 [Cordylochernes scorpioides]|uniref:Transposase n=1 Tax=Cordylochernes scorpioides TaxID=51811 RepID=A0ABY6KDZ6_9ARAC|nr:hypothetical protein LAZ67_4003783 [Cordylochernes scorpioides]
MKAAEDCIKAFSDLIKAQGYISQQVFNCDETGLSWKKIPNRTYITAEEKMMPGHKPMKDRLTLALCANASGDVAKKAKATAPNMKYKRCSSSIPGALTGYYQHGQLSPGFLGRAAVVKQRSQGKISTEDEHRPGRLVDSVTQENIDKIHDLVMLYRRMTVRQIGETLGIPKTTVGRIMREHLGLRKLSARWVPKLLTPDQKAVRRKLSSDNLALFEANPEEFVNRFVTMDETWAHHFTPESKQQYMQWRHSGSPHPQESQNSSISREAAFKLGKISTEDEHRPGRLVDSVTQENIDKIHDLVMLYRRMTVRQIGETLGIPKTTVGRIMREHLGLRKLSARWVPKLLTPDQKAVRRKLSSINLALFEANPEEFVNRFVTMDETWAHHFTPESKQQYMQWRHSGSPHPQENQNSSISREDFLNKGQTITGNYYANLVKQLREAIKENRRRKLSRKIVYHQDNAPSHRSLQAMAAIYDSGFELLPHAPYSPDLAPFDLHLFPHLKKITFWHSF